MRPPFRSVSFPSLRQWGACCPPKRRRDYKETALLYGRVAGRLTWSVNARSLRSLALGSVGFASLASLRLSLAPLVLGSGFACLGYAPAARLTGVRPPLHNSARSARSFSVSLRKKAVFSRKKSVQGERTFFPKM